jgi:hypothetical protein
MGLVVAVAVVVAGFFTLHARWSCVCAPAGASQYLQHCVWVVGASQLPVGVSQRAASFAARFDCRERAWVCSDVRLTWLQELAGALAVQVLPASLVLAHKVR